MFLCENIIKSKITLPTLFFCTRTRKIIIEKVEYYELY